MPLVALLLLSLWGGIPDQAPASTAANTQASAPATQPNAPATPANAPATRANAAATRKDAALYTVKDGNKVDAKTLNGWKTWRALACERCHGAEQEGLVGPPLVESMKVLTKEEFYHVMMNGRPEKGMPPFNTSPMVKKNWEGLYAYLKGRADGRIEPGRLLSIE